MQRKFFVKRLILCSILMVLPVVFLGVWFYIYSNVSIRRDIDQQSQNTAVLGKEYLDLFLSLAADQSALFDNSQALSLTMYKILNAQHLSYEEYNYQRTITPILNSMSNTREYVDSVYLYVDNDKGNFLGTGSGLQSIGAAADHEWLEIYEAMPRDRQYWFVQREIRRYSFETPKTTISFFNRLERINGVIVVNFDVEKMSRRLDPLQKYTAEVLLLTDNDGRVLFANSQAGIVSGQWDRGVFWQLPAGAGEDPSRVIVGGERYILTEVPSETYQLRFLSLVPEREIYRPVRQTVYCVLLAVAVALGISVLFSYYLTRKSFRQIGGVLDRLRDAENGNFSYQPAGTFRDEYDTILNNMLNVFLKNNNLRLQLADSQLRQRDAEFLALQMQINPHFLFNTLQTIDIQLRRERETAVASELVHDLSDILKYAFTGALDRVSIAEEMRYCKRYVHIQQCRYPQLFRVYWEYEEEMLERPMMRLLFQPVLENSLYHGIKRKNGNGLIRLRLTGVAGGIQVRISDNGVGMSREELRALRAKLRQQEVVEKGHIGLQNVNKRLVLAYGEGSALRVWSKRGLGSVVRFTIPDRDW